MSPRDWRDLSTVYLVGADEYRSAAMKGDGAKFHDADAFEAMANRCLVISNERQAEEGNSL